jgi:thiol-disulfide isomerase/thioredoxin
MEPMGITHSSVGSVALVLSLFGCERELESRSRAQASAQLAVDPGRASEPTAARTPAWYLAAIRAPDGVEARFLLGIPPRGAPGEAIFRSGGHDVRTAATFDGKALRIPLPVHQASVDATVAADGALTGTFSTSVRGLDASSVPLTATKIAAPSVGVLSTAGAAGVALDLRQPRTVWRLAMSESRLAKLVVEQLAPGEFSGLLFLDTGNIIYLAGTGRGDEVVLCGFDGTSGYRLELALAADHQRGRGKFFGGHRLDWRETLTATRGPEFALAIQTRPTQPGVKVGLPDHPEIAALEPGPLMVEITASWCSTCRNAAPFLVELASAYRPRGLRMLTLLYDLSDDRAADARQAEMFKSTYGVTWPVVAISGGIDVLPEILPSGLVDVNPAGFPITLFLDAERSLVALHAGFPAEDARDEFRRVAAAFRANIEDLLAHTAGPADSRSPAKAPKD